MHNKFFVNITSNKFLNRDAISKEFLEHHILEKSSNICFVQLSQNLLENCVKDLIGIVILPTNLYDIINN